MEELGIADGSLFIYGDDTEYTRRVSKKHNLYLIRDAVIDHQDAPVIRRKYDTSRMVERILLQPKPVFYDP